MSRLTLALLAATLLSALLSHAAVAHEYQLKALHVSNPFTRATPPGARVAGAFMSIQNQGGDTDRLISATSPVAGLVQIHEMGMDRGVMKMRAVKGIELKPGATVDFIPGGYHIMLEDLKQPLKQGDKIPLSLTFEKAGAMEIQVSVEAMGASAHTD